MKVSLTVSIASTSSLVKCGQVHRMTSGPWVAGLFPFIHFPHSPVFPPSLRLSLSLLFLPFVSFPPDLLLSTLPLSLPVLLSPRLPLVAAAVLPNAAGYFFLITVKHSQRHLACITATKH